MTLLVQGEVLRVIDEMATSMKTYHSSYEKMHSVREEAARVQHKLAADAKGRQRRTLEKTLEKLSAKQEKAARICDRARNEYILCISVRRRPSPPPINSPSPIAGGQRLTSQVFCRRFDRRESRNLRLTFVAAKCLLPTFAAKQKCTRKMAT